MVIIRFWFEEELDEWFQENYKTLGFSRIIVPQELGMGDYIGWRDEKEYHIELEQTPSQFFIHKPKVRNRIDIIVCWRKSVPRLKEKQEELARKEIITVAHLLNTKELEVYHYLHRIVDTAKMGESLAKKVE